MERQDPGDLLALELDDDVCMVTLCTWLSVSVRYRPVEGSVGHDLASGHTAGA